jgi:hypothetical protein
LLELKSIQVFLQCPIEYREQYSTEYVEKEQKPEKFVKNRKLKRQTSQWWASSQSQKEKDWAQVSQAETLSYTKVLLTELEAGFKKFFHFLLSLFFIVPLMSFIVEYQARIKARKNVFYE